MEDSDFLPVLMTTSPESPQMERDERGPPKQPMMESLGHKLLAHYKKGMKTPRPDLEPSSSSFSPDSLNRLSVPLFLFTIFSALKIELIDAIPLLYHDDHEYIFLQRCLVCFLLVEIMTNWFGIRYTSSSYSHYIRTYGNPLQHRQLLSKQTTKNPLTSSSIKSSVREGHTVPGCSHGNYETENFKETVKATQENHFSSKKNLAIEAERVNLWMNRRNEQINSKSIADLINVNNDDHESLSSTLQEQEPFRTKSETFDLMAPKPVIRRDGRVVTESYPYWSWVPCYVCRQTRPPRCHHCPLCKACILKRDHHCFFAGSCIGYRNYRYFIVFLFWTFIGSVYATLNIFLYLKLVIWPQMLYLDIFFPMAFIRFVFGYTSFHSVFCLTTFTFLFIFNFYIVYYLVSQSWLIYVGLTTFERLNLTSSLEIKDTRKLPQKIRAVFGRYWLLNFIFPAHCFLESDEDPVYWPNIVVLKY